MQVRERRVQPIQVRIVAFTKGLHQNFSNTYVRVRRGILFWREMLLNMLKVFDTISFVRALRTKGRTKGDMTKTVNKHVKCRQDFSPEKDSPSYADCQVIGEYYYHYLLLRVYVDSQSRSVLCLNPEELQRILVMCCQIDIGVSEICFILVQVAHEEQVSLTDQEPPPATLEQVLVPVLLVLLQVSLAIQVSVLHVSVPMYKELGPVRVREYLLVPQKVLSCMFTFARLMA